MIGNARNTQTYLSKSRCNYDRNKNQREVLYNYLWSRFWSHLTRSRLLSRSALILVSDPKLSAQASKSEEMDLRPQLSSRPGKDRNLNLEYIYIGDEKGLYYTTNTNTYEITAWRFSTPYWPQTDFTAQIEKQWWAMNGTCHLLVFNFNALGHSCMSAAVAQVVKRHTGMWWADISTLSLTACSSSTWIPSWRRVCALSSPELMVDSQDDWSVRWEDV